MVFKLGTRTRGLAARFKLLRVVVQVWHKRSWPRSDVLIGEGEVKLSPALERSAFETVVKV